MTTILFKTNGTCKCKVWIKDQDNVFLGRRNTPEKPMEKRPNCGVFDLEVRLVGEITDFRDHWFSRNAFHKNTIHFYSKKPLTMNLHFSSTTDTTRAVTPTIVTHKMRDPSSRSPELHAPLAAPLLAGTKRSRQDDMISEFSGGSKLARSSLILIQRSNTTKAL